LLKEETGWNNKQTRLALTQARKRNNEWLKKRAYGLLQLQFTSPPLYRFSLYAYLIPLTYLFDNLSGRGIIWWPPRTRDWEFGSVNFG